MKTLVEIEQGLKAKFKQEELESRVLMCDIKNGKVWEKIAYYVDARAVQERLDQVMGFNNWKTEYVTGDKGVICNLLLKIDGEWIGRQDGSDYSDMEAFKGGISGAFKRASSVWGLGRYLYDIGECFAETSLENQKGWKQGQVKASKKNGLDKDVYFYWRPQPLAKEFLPETVKTVETAKKDPNELRPNLLKPEAVKEILTHAPKTYPVSGKQENYINDLVESINKHGGSVSVDISKLDFYKAKDLIVKLNKQWETIRTKIENEGK